MVGKKNIRFTPNILASLRPCSYILVIGYCTTGFRRKFTSTKGFRGPKKVENPGPREWDEEKMILSNSCLSSQPPRYLESCPIAAWSALYAAIWSITCKYERIIQVQ